MKTIIKKLVILYTLCMTVVLSLGLTASAVTLNIPTRAQPSGSNWCWVTSAKMIGDYLTPGNGRTEAQTVKYLKGSADLSFGGNYIDHINAIKYITLNNYTYNRAPVDLLHLL